MNNLLSLLLYVWITFHRKNRVLLYMPGYIINTKYKGDTIHSQYKGDKRWKKFSIYINDICQWNDHIME